MISTSSCRNEDSNASKNFCLYASDGNSTQRLSGDTCFCWLYSDSEFPVGSSGSQQDTNRTTLHKMFHIHALTVLVVCDLVLAVEGSCVAMIFWAATLPAGSKRTSAQLLNPHNSTYLETTITFHACSASPSSSPVHTEVLTSYRHVASGAGPFTGWLRIREHMLFQSIPRLYAQSVNHPLPKWSSSCTPAPSEAVCLKIVAVRPIPLLSTATYRSQEYRSLSSSAGLIRESS